MDLSGLSGLSAAYPAYMAQEDQSALTRLNQLKQKEAADNMAVLPIVGRGVQHLLTGQTPGQPGGGPQPPAPGQPSAPAAPPPQAGGVPMPQPRPPEAGPQANGQMPQPVPQAPPMPPQAAPYKPPIKYNTDTGAPEVTLQNAAKSMLAANPGLENHPELLVRALSHPLITQALDRQGREDLADMRKEMATQRMQMARERLDEAGRWHDMVHGDKSAAREDTKEWRDAQGSRSDRRLDQTDTREGRLAANSAIRNDVLTQRLQMQQQDLQRKIEAGDRGAALAQWRAVTDALHKRATEVIQATSIASNLKPAERQALLDEQRQAYEAQIASIRGGVKGGATNTPDPAASPTAPGATPAPGAASPPAPPGGPAPPPASMLRPGGINVMPDGSRWRLVNGQAVAVPPQPAGQ